MHWSPIRSVDPSGAQTVADLGIAGAFVYFAEHGIPQPNHGCGSCESGLSPTLFTSIGEPPQSAAAPGGAAKGGSSSGTNASLPATTPDPRGSSPATGDPTGGPSAATLDTPGPTDTPSPIFGKSTATPQTAPFPGPGRSTPGIDLTTTAPQTDFLEGEMGQGSALAGAGRMGHFMVGVAGAEIMETGGIFVQAGNSLQASSGAGNPLGAGLNVLAIGLKVTGVILIGTGGYLVSAGSRNEN